VTFPDDFSRTEKPMPRIQQLSSSVVNKIAAGEVIERPASVVKELVENSLDAGAMRIDVSVGQGGLELIRVVDDGGGIPPDELRLAVTSHATSKLASAEDLFRVRTLGFRGEALASIAEVSRFRLRSRQADQAAGAELEVVAGVGSEIAPCSSPPGTTVEVENLFFNTPVRRKFLRSTQTEMGHVSEVFTRLALAHPERHFTLRHNGRMIYDLAPAVDWRSRIALFFGQDLADELIWIESRDDDIVLRGYVARPSQSRGHARMQYLFLNGRHIRDRALQHALGEAYRGLLLTGRYPISFLNFEMPPEQVDVNVHPTKLEVRFQDSGRIYSQLLGTLRTKFLTTDLTHRLTPTTEDESAQAHDSETAERLRHELVDWAKGQVAAWSAPASADSATVAAPTAQLQPRMDFSPTWPAHAPLDLTRLGPQWRTPSAQVSTEAMPTETEDQADVRPAPMTQDIEPVRALQVHNRYLLAESDEGVMVIDQHALHERILYERIREKVLAGALETQNLLVPEPVDLPAAEAALVLEHRDLLAQLGVKVEPFGGDTVLVCSYPAMLARLSPEEVLRSLIDQLSAQGRMPERRDLLDELLHMISCKAAIKAGDRLTEQEVAALLQQRHLAQDTHHCPHGRPTALIFTREELDKQFKRT
jgi:DNA mismatch repair protein MutL